ncbi:hypothetical protein HOT36_gp31 [Ralstonia phage RPSC1]|uniref:Uncharacterized protein n=1 Tax=Ralstonia phage RPSC1 TaxID=2041351 RepID=A0A2Z2U7X0_9CAUD|nr:hypothetical protein HOT36_gp31 [Ralstonia phage RPSC1]ATN92961.1 hypothetical protein RPSC1_30 [Ralstonia phage RPSC1]
MATAITTTTVYEGLAAQDRLLILKVGTDDANDYVDVEYLLGTDWVLSERFLNSGAKICFFGSSKFRIVPHGIAAYNLG